MKITQSQLRKLIKEELKAVLGESMQKMLGLPHQYTTQDLATAVQGLIKSPREDMTPNSDQAAAVEKLISNHIRKYGTPEEKEALKKLRDDFLKSIGDVYGVGRPSVYAGQTRYEKSRQSRGDAAKRRAEMQESAMNEGYPTAGGPGRSAPEVPLTDTMKIVDGYVNAAAERMVGDGESAEAAILSVIDRAIAGGDRVLDPEQDLKIFADVFIALVGSVEQVRAIADQLGRGEEATLDEARSDDAIKQQLGDLGVPFPERAGLVPLFRSGPITPARVWDARKKKKKRAQEKG